MENIRKWLGVLVEIIYVVSMTVLGYFSIRENTFDLPLYQIIVGIYVISGIVKYKMSGGLTIELKNDMLKDFFTAILSIVVLMKISQSNDYSAVESAISILVHNVALLCVFKLMGRSEKLSGGIVYYTYPIAFFITLVMIKLGLPIFISVIIGTLIPEPFNYIGYKKINDIQ